MLSQIVSLLDIQELDKERLELTEQLRKYPEIWQAIQDKRDAAERALQECQKADTDFQTSRRRLEMEIKIGRDLLKDYETKISLIRTQREVTALSTQIDQTRQRVGKLEEEREELIKREQGLIENREAAQKTFDALRREAEVERKRIRSQMRTKKERLSELESARKKLEVSVERDQLILYNRLLLRWPGSAVVPVRNGSCAGCHFAVLPMKMVDIHREEQPVYCDNCGRLFSQDEDYKAEPETAGLQKSQ